MQDPRSERFIRSRMKTRHLVLLDELGEHRSILHAAIAANMTQPAASKMLSELELVLGTPLFERLPRGVTATPFGEIMIRARPRAALAEMNLAHQEVMNLMSGLNGCVAVGTVLTPATDLLPAAVLRLKSRYPKLHVAIEVDASKALLARLRSGQLEMMVGRILEPEAAGELDFEPLSDEPHSIFARAGHPLQGRDDLKLDDPRRRRLDPAGRGQHPARPPHRPVPVGRPRPARAHHRDHLAADDHAPAGAERHGRRAAARRSVRTYLENRLLAALPIEPRAAGLDPYGIVTRRTTIRCRRAARRCCRRCATTASAAAVAACPRRGQFAGAHAVESVRHGPLTSARRRRACGAGKEEGASPICGHRPAKIQGSGIALSRVPALRSSMTPGRDTGRCQTLSVTHNYWRLLRAASRLGCMPAALWPGAARLASRGHIALAPGWADAWLSGIAVRRNPEPGRPGFSGLPVKVRPRNAG